MSDDHLQELPPGWEHAALYKRVLAAIQTIPQHFKPQARIAGVDVADLSRLGSALVSTIENPIVAALNTMRLIWDPANEYSAYSFIRHPQMFPGVRLCRAAGSDDIIMGIELIGWFALAREQEPNFRFQRTPSVCAAQDLVVVVPWALSEVTEGTPIAFDPYVESAKRLAAARNNYWQRGRRTGADTTIESPVGVSPYPKKLDGIDDKPTVDAGNFGRIARTGLMDDFIAQTMQVVLRDRSIEAWIKNVAWIRADRGDLTPTPPGVA